MNRLLLGAIILLVGLLDVTPCVAASCCEGCGCQPCTKKVCRLVCDKKKVNKPDYSIKCEDFCLPGPSIKCKVPCCCPEGCHSSCHHGYKIVYKPTCGKVRTRKDLVIGKKEEEVSTYKCVVEEVCSRCGHCAHRTTYPAAADAATAMALAGQTGSEVLTEGNETTSPQTPVMQVSAASTASRSFLERLFAPK